MSEPVRCPNCRHELPASVTQTAKRDEKRGVEELSYLIVVSVHAVCWVLLAAFVFTQAPGRWTFAVVVVGVGSLLGTAWTHQRYLDAKHIRRTELEAERIEHARPVEEGPPKTTTGEYVPPTDDAWGD
jgi:hypothetical protein